METMETTKPTPTPTPSVTVADATSLQFTVVETTNGASSNLQLLQ